MFINHTFCYNGYPGYQMCAVVCAVGDLFFVSVVYTRNGDKCAFPFKAFGKTYNSCTTDHVTVKEPWCSLTYDYDKDRRMGYCDFDKAG